MPKPPKWAVTLYMSVYPAERDREFSALSTAIKSNLVVGLIAHREPPREWRRIQYGSGTASQDTQMYRYQYQDRAPRAIYG